MEPASSVTPSPPADRYGNTRRRKPSPRWVLVALGVLVVAAGLVVAWVGYTNFGPKEIDSTAVSFDVIDDSTLQLRFTVTRDDPTRDAVCIIRARSKDGSETGRREVLVEGSKSGTVEVTSAIRTSLPPAVGDVYACSYEVPDYLRPDTG